MVATSNSPPSLQISDSLPRTMARIRRLVRENPNDRELQRLLHTLLTSMSSDRIDEGEVHKVLQQMEQRKGARTRDSHDPLSSPPLTLAAAQLAADGGEWDVRGSGRRASSSPERAGMTTPVRSSGQSLGGMSDGGPSGAIARAAAAIAIAERQQRAYAEQYGGGGDDNSGVSGGACTPGAVPGAASSPTQPTCASFRRLAGAVPLAPWPLDASAAEMAWGAPEGAEAVPSPLAAPPPVSAAAGGGVGPPGARLEAATALAGGYWSHERHERALEAQRRRHEQALSALRETAARDARQAEAHAEFALTQLRRQTDEQLASAAEARRAEASKADALALQLRDAQARLARAERLAPASVASTASAASGEGSASGGGAGAGAAIEAQMAEELSAMARSHRLELAAKERAAAAVLEREVAARERAIRELEERFAVERRALEAEAARLEARSVELEAHAERATASFRARAEAAEATLPIERAERRQLQAALDAARQEWREQQASEAARRQHEDERLAERTLSGALADVRGAAMAELEQSKAEARVAARREVWEEARQAAEEEARVELLAQRAKYQEVEAARAAAEARAEAASAEADRARRAAYDDGQAAGREAAWDEARHVARVEMEAEVQRQSVTQAAAAESKLRELEHARAQVPPPRRRHRAAATLTRLPRLASRPRLPCTIPSPSIRPTA